MNAYAIKPMQSEHSQTVIEIFNYYARETYSAFYSQPLSYGDMAKFEAMSGGYPRLVALTAEGAVAGFGLLRPYHPADTLKRTAEICYFVDTIHTRRGIGTLLLQGLLEAGRQIGVHNIIATICARNEESIAFHCKHGFLECGRIQKAGVKFGHEYDIVLMQRQI